MVGLLAETKYDTASYVYIKDSLKNEDLESAAVIL